MPKNQEKDLNQTIGFGVKAKRELFGMAAAGAVLAAYALGLFAVFVLAFKAPDIYNQSLERWDTALLPIVEQGAFAEMGEFIRRIGLDASDPEAIPMGIGAPWMVFLLIMLGLAYTLPRQLGSMVEAIVFKDTDLMAEPTAEK
jgi:hypothetical protein